MNETSVVVVEKQRELSVMEVKTQVAKVQELMRDLMLDGTHYGESFQGDTKKNLLKPGADKLCFMFRLRPDFYQEIKNLSDGHLETLTRCQIFHIESGKKIAEGVGFASTMESKFRWRNAAKKCPHCGKEAIIKGKEEFGGGWICFVKKGGCGAKFNEKDVSITNQAIGKIENPDIADTYNTVIKMSKKRAYVDATITACAASDIFSQDAEDLSESLAQEAAKYEERNVTNDMSAPDSDTPPPSTPRNGNGANQPQKQTPKPQNGNTTQQTEKAAIGKAIGEIFQTENPDKLPFFSKEEIEAERTLFAHGDFNAAKVQHDRLKKELEKRKAEWTPIPFEDDYPFEQDKEEQSEIF